MGSFKDLTGMKFGRLTVIKRTESDKHGHAKFLCKCECKNECVVSGDNLKRNHTISCGCYREERTIQARTIHGKTNTRLYRIYTGMKTRCYDVNNKNYKNYGARGITICKEWLENFMSFYNWAMLNGYHDDLSIDRINVNGNYEPSNCRWATREEQANNTTKNHHIEYDGEIKTLEKWSETVGINKSLIYRRLENGWGVEKALIEKPIVGKNQYGFKTIEYNGEFHTLADWERITGISKKTIFDRLKRGWSVERALTEKTIAGKNQTYKEHKDK